MSMPDVPKELMTAEEMSAKKAESKAAPMRVMPDFTAPEVLYEELLKCIRKYHPSDDLSQIEKAYHMAYEAHKDQRRKSGEPYIIHPICVAIILAELELDKESIIAGLLHDVVEDTPITSEEVCREFGQEVSELVDGVTKLTQISWNKDKVEIQAENLRKMFLAMAKDIRVILIKLADRLHNIRTLQYQSPEKQQEKARETMDIYSPIANRLGISKIKTELDDRSLAYLEPEKYAELQQAMDLCREDREEFVESIIADVSEQLEKADIKAELSGRVKHFFSIYKKMVTQNKSFDEIYDIFAVRIIVDNVADCYAALGVIHKMYVPIPGRFKDYIAMPKPNMYQSLHTTLISKDGHPFEIQIRTKEMHRTAEYGIAAHWKYKEVGSGQVDMKSEEEKMNWLRQILEWQNEMSDNKEFLDILKNDLDLFSDTVYCFTPTGDVKTLPTGSTPIDFAYSIHSAVGNSMVGAKVNNKLVPIDYVIQNGDQIEIITSQNTHGPSRDWLNMVRSPQAKSKINQWFRSQFRDENIARGKELLAGACKSKGVLMSDVCKPEYLNKVMAKYGFREWEAILAAIGRGGLTEGQVVNKLIEEYEKAKKRAITDQDIITALAGGAVDPSSAAAPAAAAQPSGREKVIESSTGIIIKGMNDVDVAISFSHCCSPVPGDDIVGFVTRGRGITIHRAECENLAGFSEDEKKRMIDVEWCSTEVLKGRRFTTEIKIYANNRIGIFVDVSKIFTERQIDISSMNVRTNKQGLATIVIDFEVTCSEELLTMMDKIRTVSGVVDVTRNG